MLSFYFLHWITDLSGAEGSPLSGAEKLTCRFPRPVLASFLWSMPFLGRLAEQQETEVVESYLEARFKQTFPDAPLPEGDGAIAILRLAVMAQRGAEFAVQAFSEAPFSVRRVLSEEMALTGIDGQMFRRSSACGGPAFLIYYGPALLQRCSSLAEMSRALSALAATYAAGRRLWPRGHGGECRTVSVEVGRLRAVNIESASSGSASKEPGVWVLIRHNDREGALDLVPAVELNRLMRENAPFLCVDLSFSEAFAAEERVPMRAATPQTQRSGSLRTPTPKSFLQTSGRCDAGYPCISLS